MQSFIEPGRVLGTRAPAGIGKGALGTVPPWKMQKMIHMTNFVPMCGNH